MSNTETINETTPAREDTQCEQSGHGAFAKRLSRYSMQVLPSSFARRSRLQRQQEVSDTATAAFLKSSAETTERGSLTPAKRRKYLKELLLNNASRSGFSQVLSSETSRTSNIEQHTDWALYPMEHAWMLAAVDGNYETILEFIRDDPQLLTRKDFVSGFSVLHWLAKRGRDDIMIKLLKYAEDAGIPVNVTIKGSGGLSPLHVAAMHNQYAVVKLLVGAFGADTDAMDYSGKRAWQYLRGDAPLDMKELLGTWDDEHYSLCSQNANNNSSSDTNTPTLCEDNFERHRDEVDSPERSKKSGTLWVGSFRSWFSFFVRKTSST